MRKTFAAICLLASCLSASPVFAAASIEGTARVIDGDTLHIGERRIRLHGIDAPEGKQECIRNGAPWNCGQDASTALAQHIAGRELACRQVDTDRYRRIVAVCSIKAADAPSLNAWLIEAGWALAYRQYSMDYVGEENLARSNKSGLWAGEFQAPWEWRRRPKPRRASEIQRQETVAPAMQR